MHVRLGRGALAAALVLCAAAGLAWAGTVETTSRRMTAGDFDGDGVNEIALVYNGQIVLADLNGGAAGPVPLGLSASQITAADVDGDGTPEIAYINTGLAQSSLASYKVPTAAETIHGPGPYATGLRTLSTNNVDADANAEFLTIDNHGDAVRMWDGGVPVIQNGGLRQIASGNIKFSDDARTFEFVGRSSGGAPYVYDWDTNAYRGLGGSLTYVTTANLAADTPEDEVYGSASNGNLYMRKTDGSNWQYTNGAIDPLAGIGTGRIDPDLAAGRDLAYVIGGSLRPLYQSKTDWSSANNGSTGYVGLPQDATAGGPAAVGNFGWTDVMVANVDADGEDEIILRRQYGTYDSLHLFHNGDAGPVRLGANEKAPGNVALNKPVTGTSYDPNRFPASRVTDGRVDETFEQTYWLGVDNNVPQEFTVDLLGEYDVQQIVLRNTHNANHNDRGTQDFKVYASMDNATFTEILSGQLSAVTGANGEQISPVQVFDADTGLTPTQARYLKFQALTSTYPNNDTGLTEFMVSEDRNVALGAPVIAGSSAYNGAPFDQGGYSARRVTDGKPTDTTAGGGASYWLGSNGDPTEWITVDLGQQRDVQTIVLKNTHNQASNDRSTRAFQVWGSHDNTNFDLILEGTLSASLSSWDSDAFLPADTFSLSNGLVGGQYRYLKFQTLSSWTSGNHVGLNEIEVYEDVRSANLAALKPVIKASGAYNNDFAASRVTDMRLDEVAGNRDVPSGFSYWITPDGATDQYVTIDLLGAYSIDRFELQNCHNRGYDDRGTRNFEIWSALAVDANNDLIDPFLVYAGTLTDVRGLGYEIPFDVISAEAGEFGVFSGRYIQFVAKDYYGVGAGLNEIRVFGTVPEPGTMALFGLGLAAVGARLRKRRRS